jgi:hypothetical protein
LHRTIRDYFDKAAYLAHKEPVIVRMFYIGGSVESGEVRLQLNLWDLGLSVKCNANQQENRKRAEHRNEFA